MAGHGGGAWKVAYADFVTAMMVFFMVMWITAQSKPVKQAISQYFNDPWKTLPKPMGDAARGSPLLPTTKPNSAPGPSLAPSHKPGSLGSERCARSADQRPPRRPGRGPLRPGRARSRPRRTDRRSSPSTRATRGTWARWFSSPRDRANWMRRSKQRLKRSRRTFAASCSRSKFAGTPRRSLCRRRGAGRVAAFLRAMPGDDEFLQQQGVEPERFRLSQGGPYEPYSMTRRRRSRPTIPASRCTCSADTRKS